MSFVRTFRYAPIDGASRIARLFSVGITHNYYTLENGRCADFQIAATPDTAELMASLGLLLRNEKTGFSVFYDPDNVARLVTYLRQHAEDPDGNSGFWSRLTFLLMLVNPRFVGITALPIQLRQSDLNLYGSNCQAHWREETAVLSEGRFMGADSLYPVVGNDVALTLPHDTGRVWVTDISGATVIPPPGGDPVVIFDTGESPAAPKQATLNMSSLPYGLYTIRIETKARKPIPGTDYPRTVLFVPAGAETMVLLDMLFTQPTPEEGGVYPIAPMFDGPPDPQDCGDVHYQLPFDARSTVWQYYVVSQVPGTWLDNLEIAGPGAGFSQDPNRVALPDGSLATLFRSDDVLPMRQKSPQHFHLSGRRHDAKGQDEAIAVSRLPVAPASPVWPAQSSITGTSEMFVYV